MTTASMVGGGGTIYAKAGRIPGKSGADVSVKLQTAELLKGSAVIRFTV